MPTVDEAQVVQYFDDMLAHGFLDEVRRLRARSDLSTALPSMRCVGYRQAWELMDVHGQSLAAAQQAELRDLGIYATRQLAKRQLTWLRSMPQREVIACDAPGALARVMAAVRRRLGPTA